MGEPKQGDWSLARSSFSPAVYVMNELDPRQSGMEQDDFGQPQLLEGLAHVGKGAGTPVV